MARHETFVIVGAGLAGGTAALVLRKDGFDGRVVLLGEESEPPYERPPLSKEYLRGEAERRSFAVRGDALTDGSVEVRTGVRVEAILPAERAVVLADGERIGWDALLLTTGSAPRRLDVPGADLAGIHYLRTVADADAIRAASESAGRVVVLGGGWIAAEVAASLRSLGRSVALVAGRSTPLERVLGPEVGTVYRDLHAERGVELHMGRRVRGFRGRGAVEAVETDDGARIEGDLVVVGVGAAPRTELAATPGLEVADGILVDERLQTGVPGIFAAGDVAAAWHPVLGERIRSEHWDNAKRQGRAAARNMLGAGQPYERIPYFYSDQYDLSIEYAGYAPAWDRVVLRGDPASREFLAFWLLGGRIVAGLNANIHGANEVIGRLALARQAVDPDRLADPDVPLTDVEAPAPG